MLLLLLPFSFAQVKRGSVPGKICLSAAFISGFEWIFCAFLESLPLPVTGKVAMSMAEYPGFTLYPVCALFFALSYSGLIQWDSIRRSHLKLLIIPSTVVTLGAITNPLHHLVWTGFTPGPDATLIYHHGPLFWLFTGYFFLLSLFTFGVFFLTIITDSSRRREASLLLVLFSLPWWGGILYVTDWNPFPGYELVSFSAAFTLVGTGVAMATELVRFQTPGAIMRKIPEQCESWVAVSICNEIVFSSGEASGYADRFIIDAENRGDHLTTIPVEYAGTKFSIIAVLPEENHDEQLISQLEELFEKEQLYTNQALDLETLALHLRTNRTYLSQTVNRKYQCNLPALINQFRINHFIEETRRSGELYSIEERSKMAGFSGKSTFYRVFRKEYGMSPTEWFAENREETRLPSVTGS